MADREKVIKGLECCDYNILTNTCFQCPYLDLNKEKGMAICTAELAHNALALIREQEPVSPSEMDVSPIRMEYYCGACGALVGVESACGDDEKFRHPFCPQCGKAVLWNG